MKTVVITGSSSGLGLEMCKEFRKAGYKFQQKKLFRLMDSDVHLQ